MQRPLQVHVWNYEAYWGWYKYIGDDASDKAIRIEAEIEIEVEVDVEGWNAQWPKSLIAFDRELELDK